MQLYCTGSTGPDSLRAAAAAAAVQSQLWRQKTRAKQPVFGRVTACADRVASRLRQSAPEQQQPAAAACSCTQQQQLLLHLSSPRKKCDHDFAICVIKFGKFTVQNGDNGKNG